MRVREATEWGAFSNPLGLPYKKILTAREGWLRVSRGSALCGHLLRACLERDVDREARYGRPATARRQWRERRRRSSPKSCSEQLPRGPGQAWCHPGQRRLRVESTSWSSSFLGGALTHPNSPPQNDGDGLRMVMRLGAKLSNMTEAWWAPTVLMPGERYDGAPLYRADFAMRTMPHGIIVNQAGAPLRERGAQLQRLDEAVLRDQSQHHAAQESACLVDSRSAVPRQVPLPHQCSLANRRQSSSNATIAWPTWPRASASTLGGLMATVERFNEHAAERNRRRFSTWRQRVRPILRRPQTRAQPLPGHARRSPPSTPSRYCRAPSAPKAVPLTDEHGRVLERGQRAHRRALRGGQRGGESLLVPVIPGPGITIGAALLYGHLAARNAATAAL